VRTALLRGRVRVWLAFAASAERSVESLSPRDYRPFCLADESVYVFQNSPAVGCARTQDYRDGGLERFISLAMPSRSLGPEGGRYDEVKTSRLEKCQSFPNGATVDTEYPLPSKINAEV